MTFADVRIEIGEMDTRLVPPRLPASLLASAGLHAIGLALAVHFVGVLAAPGELPRAGIIPVSLVSLPGGGGGAKGDGAAAPPPAAEIQPLTPPPSPPPKAIERAVRNPVRPAAKPAVRPAAAPPVAAAPAGPDEGAAPAGSGSAAARGSGSGDGTGGDGSGGARPAYGSNPRPPYPLAARRLGLEGRVLLEVVIQPDGRAASVAVRESSGHRVLDDSAVETVRSRWRFIPARRDGVPVESRVTVPIRFRIHES